MIDSIRKLYIKHNGDNAKLRTFSFISQWQRMQLNFMTDSIRAFIGTNSKHNLNNQNSEIKHINTTWTTKTTKSTWVSLIRQSLCSYNWGNANSWVFIFKLRNKPTTQTTKSCCYLDNFAVNFVHFIHQQFCTIHRSQKTCAWLAEHFRTFHLSLHESVTLWTTARELRTF